MNLAFPVNKFLFFLAFSPGMQLELGVSLLLWDMLLVRLSCWSSIFMFQIAQDFSTSWQPFPVLGGGVGVGILL